MRPAPYEGHVPLTLPNYVCGTPSFGFRAIVVATFDDLITLAMRHIENNRKVVEFYRRRAEADEPGAAELLQRVQQSQTMLEDHLARLIDERCKT